MSTPVQEILMLLGDLLVQIHEKDKLINAYKMELERVENDNKQLREDLGKFQNSQANLVVRDIVKE